MPLCACVFVYVFHPPRCAHPFSHFIPPPVATRWGSDPPLPSKPRALLNLPTGSRHDGNFPFFLRGSAPTSCKDRKLKYPPFLFAWQSEKEKSVKSSLEGCLFGAHSSLVLGINLLCIRALRFIWGTVGLSYDCPYDSCFFLSKYRNAL